MSRADMLIHVHPELDVLARTNLERSLMECDGVDCAEFNHHPRPHALIVKYDPDTVEGLEILGRVRRLDPEAMRVGLQGLMQLKKATVTVAFCFAAGRLGL